MVRKALTLGAHAKLEEAMADVAAGRVKPLRRTIARQRAKFNVHA